MRFYRLNLLVLGFFLGLFLFATGCDNASTPNSTSNDSVEPTVESSTNVSRIATKEIPNILWADREKYEAEGQVAFFTDCGLYKGDTNELTGAKCLFKNDQWMLLEPKLEPKDNLLKTPLHFPVLNSVYPAIINAEKLDNFVKIYFDMTKGGGCQANYFVDKSILKFINNRKVTIHCGIKPLLGDVNIRTGYNIDGSKILYGEVTDAILTKADGFEERVSIESISFSEINSKSWLYILISVKSNIITDILLSNIEMYQGVLPMACYEHVFMN